MSQLTLRRAGPEDGAALREFLARIFPNNSKLDPAIMQWQYWDNPFGEAISYIFEDRGRIVAHNSHVPVPMKLGSERGMGLVGVDAATDPGYRGKGLHKELRAAGHEEARRLNYRVSMFFPSRGSMIPRYSRTGAEVPGGQFRIFLWPRLLPRRPALTRSHSVGVPSEVPGAPEGLDELWSRLERDYPNTVVGTQAWWDYRYEARPGSEYRFFCIRDQGVLLAAAVTVIRSAYRGRFAQMLDFLAADAAAATTLTKYILKSHPEASGIAMSALPGSPPARLLRAAGLWMLPNRLDSRRQAVEIRDLSGQKVNLNSWSVTWGHMDVV